MPGIIGAISQDHESVKNYFNSHIPQNSTSTKFVAVDELPVKIAIMHRSSNRQNFSHAKKNGIKAVLYGHCFNTVSKSQVNAEYFINQYQNYSIKNLQDLEGAFHLALVDYNNLKMLLLNDKLGVLPCFWSKDSKKILFAHEIKYLNPFSEMDIDEIGFITFLMSGYCYGDRTLFKNVRYLLPASILTIDLRSMNVSQKRYWNLVYRPQVDYEVRELVTRLNDTITESIKLFTPDRTHNRSGLFLSGGWDSKGILGTMLNLSRTPGCVITNGENDQLPFSDTFIAKQIAEKYRIPFRLNIKTPKIGKQVIRDGISKCELITDSSPEVFGQHQIAPTVFKDLDFIFKGDEVWGWQDYAFNRQQAIGQVMSNVVSDTIHELLSEHLSKNAHQIYMKEIDGIWQTCENEGWNDRKDYLYLYGRVNRYIFGLGASDERHLQVRRPFLTSKVLDVIADIPGRLRVQKNLFKQMMIKYHPSLVAFGDSYTSSIPDYYYHMRKQIFEETTEALEAGMDFGGLIKTDKILAFMKKFSPKLTPKMPPSLKSRIKQASKNRWMHYYHRIPRYQRKVADIWENKLTANDRVAFRIWLLYCYIYKANI